VRRGTRGKQILNGILEEQTKLQVHPLSHCRQ